MTTLVQNLRRGALEKICKLRVRQRYTLYCKTISISAQTEAVISRRPAAIFPASTETTLGESPLKVMRSPR
jgi:hypothetical protein